MGSFFEGKRLSLNEFRSLHVRRLGGQSFDRLFDDFEFAVIERIARRFAHFDDPFALSGAGHFERAVMTERVISGAPEGHEAGPGAPAHTLLRIVTSGAVSPEI